MIGLSINHSDQARKRMGILVALGLGTVMLTVLFLLPGCGSESTPEGTVKGKTATSAKAVKPSVAVPLKTDKQVTGPERVKEVFPGVTQEEMEARAAADRAKHDLLNPEVFPGVTREQLDAKMAAAREKHDPRLMERLPRVTREK